MRIIFAFLILSVLYTGAALAQTYFVNEGSDSVGVNELSSPPDVVVGEGPILLPIKNEV